MKLAVKPGDEPLKLRGTTKWIEHEKGTRFVTLGPDSILELRLLRDWLRRIRDDFTNHYRTTEQERKSEKGIETLDKILKQIEP